MRTVKTSRADLAGHGFLRVLRLNILDRIIPLGNLRNGPGLKPAVILLGLHLCGRLFFGLLIRYERQLHRVYQILQRRR